MNHTLFTSISLKTIAGSRGFLLRSFSSFNSWESCLNRVSDGCISSGISLLPIAPPPFADSLASISDIFNADSLSDVDKCFLFFFLSFFFSFLAIFSLIAVRLRSNAIDCNRACSISVFSSSNPGLCSRAPICGSYEKPPPPSLAELAMDSIERKAAHRVWMNFFF